MKTIIENTTNLSKYIFNDSVDISVNVENIVTPDFIIGDLNSENATLIEGVTPPADWTGCKYFYTNSEWSLDPEWTEPLIEVEE